jgi:hypothetical protein
MQPAAGDPPAPSRLSRTAALGIALALVISRLPLVGISYGSDDDAWRNIVAALHMREAGRYIPSRVPGFPLYEGLLALIAPGGWVATNLASILAGIAAAALFARLLARLRVRDARVMWFAFAFGTPLWVQCSQTIDYPFGLAFFLGSFLALLDRRSALAGVLLGIAVGCRPSYAATCLAVALFLIARRAPWRAWAAFALGFAPVAAGAITVVVLAPEARGLGAHFSQHAASHVSAVTTLPVLRLAAVYLFGKFGVCVLAVALVAAAWRALRNRPRPPETPGIAREERDAVLAFGIGLLVSVGGLYLLIPGEGAYLLPLLPFLLMALPAILPSGWCVAVALAITIQPLVSAKLDQRRFIPGDLFEEIALRRQDLTDTRALLSRNTRQPVVYVAGRFMTHRLLVLDPALERTEAGWAAFHRPGIALRSREQRVMFAEDLDPAQSAALERTGWSVVRLHQVER